MPETEKLDASHNVTTDSANELVSQPPPSTPAAPIEKKPDEQAGAVVLVDKNAKDYLDAKVVSQRKRGKMKVSKVFINPKGWLSYDEVKNNAKTVFGLFRRFFTPIKTEQRSETYEQALVRFGLNEQQAEAKKKKFLYSAIVYLIFGILFLAYFLYLLYHAKFLASFMAFILMVLMVLSFYREHFWYMQMKKKKLGCGFGDWVAFILGRS